MASVDFSQAVYTFYYAADNNISSNGVDNLTLGNWNNLTYLYLGTQNITKSVTNLY